MKKLRIALQAGGMQAATTALFGDAFLPILQKGSASFDGMIEVSGWCIEVRFMKSFSIPGQVISGKFHCGITGQDVIHQAYMEGRTHEIVTLNLARKTNQGARVVLAGMKGAKFKGKVTIYVDAEYSRLAEELIKSSENVEAELVIQPGTSEEKIINPGDFAIIATETGASLKDNNLVVVKVLMESCMVLFVDKELCAPCLTYVEDLGLLLEGVLAARPRILMKMNVIEDDKLKGVLALLPSLTSPTEMPLRDGGHALEAVVFADKAQELTPELHHAGATGIVLQDVRMVVL